MEDRLDHLISPIEVTNKHERGRKVNTRAVDRCRRPMRGGYRLVCLECLA